MRTFPAASLLAASLTASLQAQAPDPVDLPSLAQQIDETLQAHHYNPSNLIAAEYAATRDAVSALAHSAADRDAFRAGEALALGDEPPHATPG
jgi:hypothetical protein